MRQLGDLAVWVSMIMLAIGVVYFAPVVAEYITSDPKPAISAGPRAPHSMLHRHPHVGGPNLSR